MKTILTLLPTTILSLCLMSGITVTQAEENATDANPSPPPAASTDVTDAKEVVELKAQDLTLQVPKSWETETPSNNLRLAQCKIPATEGDEEAAEFVVFPPFGGTIAQNIERWVAQFSPEGRTVKMLDGECPQGKYVLVDLQGTYKKPDGPPFLRKTIDAPDYRMIAVILTAKAGGNYFLKMTGPQKTVEASLEEFRNSFGAEKSKESAREL